VSQADAAESLSFLDRHHFLFRRLHSLSGILPVGVFVIMHLFTNAQMAWGQYDEPGGMSVFQHEVDFIHSIPGLLIVEITLWASIAFHAGLGFVYIFTGKSNVNRYGYTDNWRYTLQRVSGMIALVFIFFHVATLRWRWNILGIWDTPFFARFDPQTGSTHEGVPMSLPLTAYALQYSWLVVVLYVVGALSVVYHWANGLWTAAITWGLTISTAAQQRWGQFCAALGVALTVFFVAAIYGSLAYDLREDTTPQQREALDRIVPGWRGGAEASGSAGATTSIKASICEIARGEAGRGSPQDFMMDSTAPHGKIFQEGVG